MEQRSSRDHALLGDAPRDPFASPNALPNLPHRDSDVDFNDVFGGPPRRYSIYELRHSLGESVDSFASRGGGGEEVEQSRRPWSSLSEKPVFGESASPARRRFLGDDFFNDIFRGSDSVCSTPRKPDRDSFSSTPGSRILSPTRPLPPRCEPFSGASSLPSQLSLSMKLGKGLDYQPFSSPTHRAPSKKDGIQNSFRFLSSPTACVPSIATGMVQAQDDPRSDSHPSNHQSPLTHQFSNRQDRSSEASECANHDTDGHFKKDSTASGVYNSSSQFHFSIYKWASKGVTLVMPTKSKERAKKESRFSGLPVPVLQGVNLPSHAEKLSTEIRTLQNQCENQDSSSSRGLTAVSKDDIDSTRQVEEVIPAKFDLKSTPSDITEEPGWETELTMDGTSHDVGACNNISEVVPVSIQEAYKAEFKNLNPERQGNEDIIKQAEEKEHLVKEVTSPIAQDAPVTLEDKMMGNRVKGNVKEFIKIFNQEAFPKPISIVETRGWRSRVKGEGKSKVEEQLRTHVKADEERVSNRNDYGALLSDDPTAIDQILNKSEKAESDISSEANKVYDFLPDRSDTSVPRSESTLESVETSFVHIKESYCEDLEECLVEQLSQDRNELPQTDLYPEEIQIADAKIREWSNGKEGNIRSLLSTLQYVLWQGSGWKAVPLVDIIEGSSVKRAYQKALLCLHPDKLQQKGAAMHQKYIAEKIFDILQEAWTHFNSVSSL